MFETDNKDILLYIIIIKTTLLSVTDINHINPYRSLLHQMHL